MNQTHIRNFCIIAHIDHGKTTLSDRLLEYTGTISSREMVEQVLDSMELEREKGITIKARAVRMYYRRGGEEYELNLIDTPGHVDFTYEVSRSLAACEGALLVVDAAQGIEAQTLANVYLALENDLVILPVVNKIDLPNAQPQAVAQDLERTLGIPATQVVFTSAKEGVGTQQLLEAVVHRIPPPKGYRHQPLRALIFDSHYDYYKGVVAHLRVVDGSLRQGTRIVMMSAHKQAEVLEIGIFRPHPVAVEELSTGEVGYVATGLKDVADSPVGDTITEAANPADVPLPGYRPAKPMVFAGLYPVEGADYSLLRDALEKLRLNDAALSFETETSVALGFGFRCGFLGLLHMEIVQERLEREYGLKLLTTSPGVQYMVTTTTGQQIAVDNPARLPPPGEIAQISEPFVRVTIIAPSRYIGSIMELVTTRRGQLVKMEYLDQQRVTLTYDMALTEMLVDFYDQLKSRTQGYGSMDYVFDSYRPGRLVKLELLVNNQPLDALSLITHADDAYARGRELVAKLRQLIPRQLFEVPIQAAIGSRVIARQTIPALRKNVLEKCYGGDVTRKRKLLERQAEGKRRMKRVGNVEIPQEAFMAVLKLGG